MRFLTELSELVLTISCFWSTDERFVVTIWLKLSYLYSCCEICYSGAVNGITDHLNKTGMPFGRRGTINGTHRSQKHLELISLWFSFQ